MNGVRRKTIEQFLGKLLRQFFFNLEPREILYEYFGGLFTLSSWRIYFFIMYIILYLLYYIALIIFFYINNSKFKYRKNFIF